MANTNLSLNVAKKASPVVWARERNRVQVSIASPPEACTELNQVMEGLAIFPSANQRKSTMCLGGMRARFLQHAAGDVLLRLRFRGFVFAGAHAADVGAEFLENIAGHVDGELGAEAGEAVRNVAVVGVVGHGNGDGG